MISSIRIIAIFSTLVSLIIASPLMFAASLIAVVFLTGYLVPAVVATLAFFALFASSGDILILLAFLAMLCAARLLRSGFTFA